MLTLRNFGFFILFAYKINLTDFFFLNGLSITLLGLKFEDYWFWRCICLYSYNSFSFSYIWTIFSIDALSIHTCHPKICYFKLRGIAWRWTQFWHNEHSLFKDQFEPSHYLHHNYLPKSKAYKTMLFWKTINGSTLKNSKANILHAFYVHV